MSMFVLIILLNRMKLVCEYANELRRDDGTDCKCVNRINLSP